MTHSHRTRALNSVQNDRVAGALNGTALGDALGAPYEFGEPLPASSRVESRRPRRSGKQPQEIRTCRSCGEAGLPIVYGLPGPGLVEACERGEVLLGGCCLTESDPAWTCPSCGDSW